MASKWRIPRERRNIWPVVRSMQRGYAGLGAAKSMMVRNRDGDMCSSDAENLIRWQDHFKVVFDLPSNYVEGAFDEIPQRPPLTEFEASPTREEIQQALKDTKMGTAAGESGVVPERLVYGDTRCTSGVGCCSVEGTARG
jgi:hypothetical protein